MVNVKHAKAADEWMESNPQAYELFDRFALQMAETGQKFGAKLVAERIRWECHLKKIGTFKWNNNHTTYVALRWVDENPRYKDLLEFRTGEQENPGEGVLF